MELDYQDAFTSFFTLIAGYLGYRGKQMDDKISALEADNAGQAVAIGKVETKVRSLEENHEDVKKAIETVSYDVKEILRHLRDSK